MSTTAAAPTSTAEMRTTEASPAEAGAAVASTAANTSESTAAASTTGPAMAQESNALQHTPGRPRLFLLGFNKCGTTSFHDFFRANGIASVHWRANTLALTMQRHRRSGHRPLLDGLEQWTAYTDMICLPGTPWGRSNSDGEPVIEACTFFRELHRDYPDALFILNTRDPFDWIRSRLQHDQGRFAAAYQAALAEEGVRNRRQLRERWLRDWHAHHSAVLEYFHGQAPRQLLVFHLDHTPHKRLIRFLKPHFPLPAPLFPHHHRSSPRRESSPAA